MPSRPLNTSVRVQLDGAGNGVAAIGPAVGQTWHLTVAAVSTLTAALFPSCLIYIGGAASPENFVDGTFTGNQDSSSRVSSYPLTAGHRIFAVWANGDPNTIATLSLFGTEVSP